MKHHGNQESGSYANLPSLSESGGKLTEPVFSGKYSPVPSQNLAVQRSLMEIFDDFTQIISGELQSMNLEQFEAERKRQKLPYAP